MERDNTIKRDTSRRLHVRESNAVKVPLVVDLDGSLLRSDLLIESAFSVLGQRPSFLLAMITALLFKGKAALKHELALLARLDPSTLPYDDVVLERVRRAAQDGRQVYLVSASDERMVKLVADHIGVFDGWFGSDGTTNLAGEAKARHLVDRFGEKGFDYIGNGVADLAVWRHAAKAIAIRASSGVRRRLSQMTDNLEYLPSPKPDFRNWLTLIRVHQYAKNSLVFVPVLTAHRFELDLIAEAVLAAIAFCLCASSIYILNDLVDLQADRAHPTKRRRPLANGSIPLLQGMFAIPGLLIPSLTIAGLVSVSFLGVLLAYMSLTMAYSVLLKRKMLVDVVALALLYTVRVVGGAVAIEVGVSEWMLAFSMFIFMSLALIKRYVDLSMRLDTNRPDPLDRNYKISDLGIIAALAAAAGFNAVTVFALYISSETVHQLYTRPAILWLACPVLMYWIGRCLLMAHRRHMDDDPIVFALKDRISFLTIVVIGVLVLAAI